MIIPKDNYLELGLSGMAPRERPRDIEQEVARVALFKKRSNLEIDE